MVPQPDPPRHVSPDLAAFEVVIPETQDPTSVDLQVSGPKAYRWVDDKPEGEAGPSRMVAQKNKSVEMPPCVVLEQDPVEPETESLRQEDLVDYEDEDVAGAGDEVPDNSAQVLTSNPYEFD